MKLLAIDTSGPVCGVAILTEEGIRHECAVMNHKTHSVNLLPMIDQAFQSTGLTLAEMDRLAVVVGPGSFTGVRLGVSTVKGLAHGAGKPCVAVNALEAMAAGISNFAVEKGCLICPIQDARAGQVYGAVFSADGAQPERPKRLKEDAPMKLEAYVEEIRPLGDKFLFLGDGMPVHRARLQALLGDRALFAQPQHAFLRPASVAYLASLETETVDYLTLMPLYLRAPNATLNRKLTEGLHA